MTICENTIDYLRSLCIFSISCLQHRPRLRLCCLRVCRLPLVSTELLFHVNDIHKTRYGSNRKQRLWSELVACLGVWRSRYSWSPPIMYRLDPFLAATTPTPTLLPTGLPTTIGEDKTSLSCQRLPLDRIRCLKKEPTVEKTLERFEW